MNPPEPDPVYKLDGNYEVKEILGSNGTHCNATIYVITPAWVKDYTMKYSDTGFDWNNVITSGKPKVFFISNT
jgi:hypothetical protein